MPVLSRAEGRLRCALSLTALALIGATSAFAQTPASAPTPVQREESGNRVSENVPAIPTALIELLQLVYQRPDISTGSLIAHFEGRDEYAALQKLASQSLPGEDGRGTGQHEGGDGQGVTQAPFGAVQDRHR